MPKMQPLDKILKDIEFLDKKAQKDKAIIDSGERQEPNYNITDNGISFARRIAIVNWQGAIRSLGKTIKELDELGDKDADQVCEIAEKLSDLLKEFREDKNEPKRVY